ncbi:MAG: glycerol-3-phosphate 1-O-acyltransferase PlsY [Betaproteobacteria bacterium]|nr:glycerol-3-phosphate 1-O-acyltransferase PlsY [Betaproteobacteria bacterium]
MAPIAIGLLAYLIGSVSFAVVTSRAFGLPDPRTYGSRNPGATNVLRTGKKLAAALTLLGDAAKGGVAVALAAAVAPRLGLGEEWVAAAGLSVFIGHLYPVFLRFRGGKGVATALGVLLALDSWLGASVLGTWIAVALIGRISSLAAISAAALAPVYSVYFLGTGWATLAVLVMALLLIWRHRANIRNLLTGQEARIGAGGKAAGPAGSARQ